MAVTNPTAIQFSNERIRVGADRLAWAYYRCDLLRDRWDALGGGQPAIDVLLNDIRAAANHLADLYEFCFRSENLWFLLGGTSLIPNDAGESIVDGSPADGRPAINGQKAVALVDRIVQFQNWLRSATGSFTDAARNSLAYYNTVLACTSQGPSPMSVGDAGNFMNRCGELRTRYEASSNQELGTILAVSPNPQG